MTFYNCPYCIIISNRKYNMIRHINRKHPEMEIPNNLLSRFKKGLYSCPYCLTTSNRKYNMKEHITRKHPGTKIPNNLNSTNKNFTNSSLLSQTATIFPPWLKYAYIQNISLPPLYTSSSTKENRNTSLFKTIFEFLVYKNFIQNHISLQSPYFYQNNNLLNFNSFNVYYEPLSNIEFGKPLLFKIYKCHVCFIDTPTMFSVFDSIKISSEHRCSVKCNFLSRTNGEYKNTIDPIIQEFSLNKIISIINKKTDPKSKLCLKSIKIPSDFHEQLNFDHIQFNINKKLNENNNKIPSWLQKLLLYEQFVDLKNTDENNWAHRLTTSNNNTEITREELIRFIKLSNATFGLFKFQKDHSITHYFFAYIQLERV
jgi:hypothetical protein